MTAPPLLARPDAPRPGDALSRRGVLAGTALLALPLPALADPVGALDDAGFLRLSQAATGHADLDATLAARMLTALRAADAAFGGRATALAALLQPGMEADALLASSPH